MTPYAPYPLNLLRDGLHRWRWVIRGVMTAVLVPWAVFWAYSRLSDEPVRPLGIGVGFVVPQTAFMNHDVLIELPPPEVDETKALATAIQTLPPMPTVPPMPTPPEGMTWRKQGILRQRGRATRISVDEVRAGPWQPRQRLSQQLFLQYLQSPPVEKTLQRIAELSDQPAALSHSTGLGYTGGAAFRQLAHMLVAKSRCHAEVGEYEQALADLTTLIALCNNLEDEGLLIPVLVAGACRSLAIHELIVQARTLDHDPAQLRAMLEWLKARPVDTRATYLRALRQDQQLHYTAIDALFTLDDDGNGRLCVDRTGLGPGLDQFLLVQNLVHGAYDDRVTHLRHIDDICSIEQKVVSLPFGEGAKLLDAMEYVPLTPTLAYSIHPLRHLPIMIARGQADHEIALAMLAVLALYEEYGVYPVRLDYVVPEYLDSVPTDPFVDAPLRYRLDERYGFIVYATGENLRDDGGQFESAPGEDLDRDALQDYFFGRPRKGSWRSEPNDDWILVPTDDEWQAESRSTSTEEAATP